MVRLSNCECLKEYRRYKFFIVESHNKFQVKVESESPYFCHYYNEKDFDRCFNCN